MAPLSSLHVHTCAHTCTGMNTRECTCMCIREHIPSCTALVLSPSLGPCQGSWKSPAIPHAGQCSWYLPQGCLSNPPDHCHLFYLMTSTLLCPEHDCVPSTSPASSFKFIIYADQSVLSPFLARRDRRMVTFSDRH